MISSTRSWLRRHRTSIGLCVGVLSAGYVAAQYISSKLSSARERMSGDRIARENLRRRFEQNQEDCTLTTLALIPALSTLVLEDLPVENITRELQLKKAERLAAAANVNAGAGRRGTGREEEDGGSSAGQPTSLTEDDDDDGRSAAHSLTSESYGRASQAIVEGGGEDGSAPTGASSAAAAAAAGEGSAGNAAPSSNRPRKTKAQLWAELKIASITRTFTLIYSLALLTLLTRIQLNLLGRRSYLASVMSLATPSPSDSATINLESRDGNSSPEAKYGDDYEVNQRYLAFSWWLLHRGWKLLREEVETAVKEVFGPLDPRDDVSFDRLAQLTLRVRKKVEGETPRERRNYLPYLLPPVEQEALVLEQSGAAFAPSLASTSASSSSSSSSSLLVLRRLLDETADLIESPTFAHVLTQLLDAGFSLLIDKKVSQQAFSHTHHNNQQAVAPPPPPASSPSFTSAVPAAAAAAAEPSSPSAAPSQPTMSTATTKLANILAVVTRQAHIIGNSNSNSNSSSGGTGDFVGIVGDSHVVANEYLRVMDTGARDLEGFSAVVYCEGLDFEMDHATAAATADETADGGVSGRQKKGTKKQGKEEEGENKKSGVDVGGSSSVFENVWGKAIAGGVEG
ncbi:MAG: peroxin [Peltula sp. TS41687]|nr:MAG: peroxin [Peltula sp. TS41687]